MSADAEPSIPHTTPQETFMNASAPTTYSVPEISCGHCKSTIEAAVEGVDEVRSVDVDIDAKTVTVRGGHGDAIIAAIEDVGYDVVR